MPTRSGQLRAMKRHSMPQVRTRLLEGAWSCARKENCNFSKCKCGPCGRKGRSKLTGYACLSLDDQRRLQEFVPRPQTSKKCQIKRIFSENAERLRCGSDKM